MTLNLIEVKTGDGVRIRDKNNNEATGPATVDRVGGVMTVEAFGRKVMFARYSSKAGRTKTGDWVVAAGIKIVGHQPAMF